MAGPIYLMYVMKSKEAWYQLSDEARDELLEQIGASVAAAGGEHLVNCDARWSTEPWQFFGVIRFPDIEAIQRHRSETSAMSWERYFDAMSMLGTELQP